MMQHNMLVGENHGVMKTVRQAEDSIGSSKLEKIK